jgi:hypothetical protein
MSQPADADDEANFSRGRELLGAFVPTIRLLAKEEADSLFFYEMSRISGISYSERKRMPGLLAAMPTTGKVLALCLPSYARIRRCQQGKALVALPPLWKLPSRFQIVPFRKE